MKGRIKLIYSCKENLSAMKPEQDGFYCAKCTHHVKDYSRMSLKDFYELENKTKCGIFSPEQLNPDLIPLKTPQGLKNVLFSFLTFFGVSTGNISAQTADSVKTELVENKLTKALNSNKYLKEYQRKAKKYESKNHRIYYWGYNEFVMAKLRYPWYSKRRTFHRKLYLSLNFPFIHFPVFQTKGLYSVEEPSKKSCKYYKH